MILKPSNGDRLITDVPRSFYTVFKVITVLHLRISFANLCDLSCNKTYLLVYCF